MALPLVELRGITKRYGAADALHPLDLDLPRGATTALIGPSGCGKSTLLRLIVGLIRPDGGTLRLDGRELTPGSVRALRARMGYVIQDGGLFPHLTAEENVTLRARHDGWPPDRVAARLAELADLARLPREGLARYPTQISGGQRQRVSLMRALFMDPDLLLLDEPLGALDPIIRSDLQNDLRAICQRLAKTVLLVTHDIGEAGFLADRIVLLRAGRLVQQGSLEDLVQRPADPFVTQFINAQRSPLESLPVAP
jgi:osmoprotectant transport system ATP-binding protein